MKMDAETRRRLGAVVKRARMRAGYRTLAQLSDELDISTKTLGNLEAGRRVSDETVYAVATLLGWEDDYLDYLVTGDPLLPYLDGLLRVSSGEPGWVDNEEANLDVADILNSKRLSDSEKRVLIATLRALRGDGPVERQHETG